MEGKKRYNAGWKDTERRTGTMEERFLPYVPRDDIYLFNTGNARKAWLCFGCRFIPELQMHRFLVWAPNARSVNLVGESAISTVWRARTAGGS